MDQTSVILNNPRKRLIHALCFAPSLLVKQGLDVWSYRADTDVLVVLVNFAPQLCQEILMKTGTAQQRRFVAVHNIQLQETLQRNIPAYHVLTGCDTVSQLSGHGKKSTGKIFHKHGALLTSLWHDALSEATMEQVEEFICRIYMPNTNDISIN
jgi:5'-3' exonuclease